MKIYTIPERTVTEVEKSDWDTLERMTTREALDYMDQVDIEDYTGGYSYGSKETYHFYKAKMLKACGIIKRYAERKMMEDGE